MADIIDLLCDDHRSMREMLTLLLGDAGGAQSEQLFGTLRLLLTAHARFEEASLYPLLAQDLATAGVSQHAGEQHRQMDVLLDALSRWDADEGTRRARLSVLQEDLTLHLQVEECSLLPLIGTTVASAVLRQLGDAYRASSAPLPMLTPALTRRSAPAPAFLRQPTRWR